FFFQADDGIRDFHVTGVQTCALPILSSTQEFNRLSLGALEKLVNFHLEKLPSYTSLSIAQWRALLDIKDTSGLQDYLNSRPQLEIGRASCRESVDIPGACVASKGKRV